MLYRSGLMGSRLRAVHTNASVLNQAPWFKSRIHNDLSQSTLAQRSSDSGLSWLQNHHCARHFGIRIQSPLELPSTSVTGHSRHRNPPFADSFNAGGQTLAEGFEGKPRESNDQNPHGNVMKGTMMFHGHRLTHFDRAHQLVEEQPKRQAADGSRRQIHCEHSPAGLYRSHRWSPHCSPDRP